VADVAPGAEVDVLKTPFDTQAGNRVARIADPDGPGFSLRRHAAG
jgi:hypothetical protein